nr:UvrB/UvrC motif-containing protein [uncultured Oscillibacter sp.]
MKCEHCGKNEVTFVYQSNVNGQVTEKHLCSECAEKLGYTQKLAAHSQRMMQNFFGGSLFEDFFTPFPSLLGRMNRLLENPFDDFFSDMPALGAPAETRQEAQQPQETLLKQEEQNEISKTRELNALRMEMQKAVAEENFERAAELRDQIHSLEA